jgi:hypothetical protein
MCVPDFGLLNECQGRCVLSDEAVVLYNAHDSQPLSRSAAGHAIARQPTVPEVGKPGTISISEKWMRWLPALSS